MIVSTMIMHSLLGFDVMCPLLIFYAFTFAMNFINFSDVEP